MIIQARNDNLPNKLYNLKPHSETGCQFGYIFKFIWRDIHFLDKIILSLVVHD